MYANGRFRMGDRLPDGLMLAKMERKGCFEIKPEIFLIGH